MAALVPFTDNIRDLSNTQGYQFEFRCERCGNGHRSPFKRDNVETGRKLLRAAGTLFGGFAQSVSRSVDQWQYDRATNSPAKDRALAEAVERVRDEFRQCRGCGDWMCAAMCWNSDIGQCLRCAPAVAEEIARAQAAAQRDQIWQRAQQSDWTAGEDMDTRAVVVCPSCGVRVDGGRFCSMCGASLAPKVHCSGCGSGNNKIGAMFCMDCGRALH
ncbi:zinc ribbon domain-containing protein [Dactylosporangium roseum]|uniref:Zinc ribbon domain-containing protein n=1 Tax=Dactylosporangium roseum TaxID=47989 RepID=A0ABY5Z118_9ACTN|nr:zinc ribbon domain-containing protein [Dactylosporangium roseum]UWZ34184.1 zinc ribbon domain-containing protein [Dactylosporangium roseum]